MQQLEFDLEIDSKIKFKIDIETLQNQQEKIRRSFFARMHAMEKTVEDQNLQIEFLKRELEALRICI